MGLSKSLLRKGKRKGGHKSNEAKVKYRERWNHRHPEGRKIYSLRRRISAFKRTIAVMERKLERIEKEKNILRD